MLHNIYNNDKVLVNKFLEGFPNRIVLFNDAKFQDYKTHQLDLDENMVIDLSKLLNHIVNNDLLTSLEKLYLSMSKQLQNQIDEINNLIEPFKTGQPVNGKSKILAEQISEKLKALDELIKKTNLLRENTELSINERLNATWDKLSLSTLSIQNEMLSYYIREEKSAERKDVLSKLLKKLSANKTS